MLGLTRTVPELGDRNRRAKRAVFPRLKSSHLARIAVSLARETSIKISESIRMDFKTRAF
jgi:hypothetical protein